MPIHAPELHRVPPNFILWNAYDPKAKVELFSTALHTSAGLFLVDPIPLQTEPLEELQELGRLAGVILTNANHVRASKQFADHFSLPIIAHSASYPDASPPLQAVAEGARIGEEIEVIEIAGAASGEIVLHVAHGGGTLVVGDALIHFDPYGFTFLPVKYCANHREMRRSLRKLLDYRIERIFFAHGAPILKKGGERLALLLNSDA